MAKLSPVLDFNPKMPLDLPGLDTACGTATGNLGLTNTAPSILDFNLRGFSGHRT